MNVCVCLCVCLIMFEIFEAIMTDIKGLLCGIMITLLRVDLIHLPFMWHALLSPRWLQEE